MTPAARERARVRVPILLASAGAWALAVVHPGGTAPPCHAPAEAATSALPLQPGAIGGWALMLVAMMLPALGPPILHVRSRSFACRRARATALFLAGYAAPWMAVGLASLATAAWVRAAASAPVAWSIAMLAGLWQVSPGKQACLNRLHAHPELSAFGLAADADALRFGAEHGAWCVGSCAALMLLPLLLSTGHLWAMAAVSLWIWGEAIERPIAPRWSWRFPARAVRLAVAEARTAGFAAVPRPK